MTKEEFIQAYPDLASHSSLRGYLRNDALSLPEIQAQVKRSILRYLQDDDARDRATKAIYLQFLEATEAPPDIEHRYTGEHCTRIYASREQIADLMNNRPSYLYGGIAFLRKETDETCIVWKSAIDANVANWLRAQGIRLEFVWESEIGRINAPTI